jgi:hypothetical protein
MLCSVYNLGIATRRRRCGQKCLVNCREFLFFLVDSPGGTLYKFSDSMFPFRGTSSITDCVQSVVVNRCSELWT